jgi:hypothetical protein
MNPIGTGLPKGFTFYPLAPACEDGGVNSIVGNEEKASGSDEAVKP